jgi:YtoQ family protein
MSFWTVYLSGEIHTDWRERIIQGCAEKELDIEFTGPVTDHEASDKVGVNILGAEEKRFWEDRLGAGINGIRTRKLIDQADLVIVRFGPKYKQWNAAFDAGYTAAQGTPMIILHDEEHDHPLKEVDAAADAVARTPEQVVEMLVYILNA